jgi:serine/threonine protein kinase
MDVEETKVDQTKVEKPTGYPIKHGVMVMEYMAPLNDDLSLSEFEELLGLVDLAHEKGVWFQDLYVRNIMRTKTDNAPRLIDFGFCTMFHGPVPQVLRGTDLAGLLCGDATFKALPDRSLRVLHMGWDEKRAFLESRYGEDMTRLILAWKVHAGSKTDPEEGVHTFSGMYPVAAYLGWPWLGHPTYTGFSSRANGITVAGTGQIEEFLGVEDAGEALLTPLDRPALFILTLCNPAYDSKMYTLTNARLSVAQVYEAFVQYAHLWVCLFPGRTKEEVMRRLFDVVLSDAEKKNWKSHAHSSRKTMTHYAPKALKSNRKSNRKSSQQSSRSRSRPQSGELRAPLPINVVPDIHQCDPKTQKYWCLTMDQKISKHRCPALVQDPKSGRWRKCKNRVRGVVGGMCTKHATHTAVL